MRRILILWLVALVALSVSPAAQAASAAVQSKVTATLAPQAEFSLDTSNGYSVSVEGTGRKVWLTVDRGFGSATYLTRGTAWSGGIRARFGHFGRVSVRFGPSGKVSRQRPPKRCKGRAAIVRTGVFVGTIRFKGEDGYISIDARRAKGRSSTLPRWRCKGPGGAARVSARSKQGGFETAELKATTAHERIAFGALGFRLRGEVSLTFFIAATDERRGSVRIARFALVPSGRARTFPFHRATRSVTVRPPKPFHGSATFERNADGSASWSGSLSVSLPGATVDLTGPAFKAKLSRKG